MRLKRQGGGSSGGKAGGGSYKYKPVKGGKRVQKSENKIFALVMACIIVFGIGMFIFLKAIYPVTTGAKTPSTAVTVNGQKMPGWLYDYYKIQYEDYYCSYFSGFTKAQIIALYGQEAYDDFYLDLLPFIEKSAFEDVIISAYTSQLAKEYGLKVSKEEIQAEHKAYLDLFEEQKIDYALWLKYYGLTEKRFLSYIELDLSERKLRDHLYDLVEMGDAEAEAEARKVFDEKPEEWQPRKVSHILIKVSNWSDETKQKAAYEEAMRLIEMLIEDPSRFAELAEEFSEDDASAKDGGFYDAFIFGNCYIPSLGYSFDEAFVDAAFELASVGDFTLEPVKGYWGYHIVKLEAVVTEFENLEEAEHDYIIAYLNTGLFVDKYNEVMKEKDDNAKIKRKVRFIAWTKGDEEYPR